MGQRVNIQYSVELEDLEEEVNRLYSNAITQLASLPHASLNLGTEGLDKGEAFRYKLAKVDIMLGDVQNIIEGFVRFKTSPQQQEQLQVEPEALQDKISKFKELLNENTNQESPV